MVELRVLYWYFCGNLVNCLNNCYWKKVEELQYNFKGEWLFCFIDILIFDIKFFLFDLKYCMSNKFFIVGEWVKL